MDSYNNGPYPLRLVMFVIMEIGTWRDKQVRCNPDSSTQENTHKWMRRKGGIIDNENPETSKTEDQGHNYCS